MTGKPAALSAMRNPLTWSLVAVAISVIALVVALVSLRGADGATVQSEQVRPGAVQTGIGSQTSTALPSETSSAEPDLATPADDSNGPVSTELPTAGASYALFKENVKVRLAGGSSRYLDLDQPMVNADSNQQDVTYFPTSNPPILRFSSANVAEAKSADVTPDECAQDIQLSPSDTSVKLSQDLVLCAVTNGIGAVNEPSRAKMAKIVVNSVSKDDSLDLTITTWEIPR